MSCAPLRVGWIRKLSPELSVAAVTLMPSNVSGAPPEGTVVVLDVVPSVSRVNV